MKGRETLVAPVQEPKDYSGVQVTVAAVVLLVGYTVALVVIVLRFRGMTS